MKRLKYAAGNRGRMDVPADVLEIANELLKDYDVSEIVEIRPDPYIGGVYAIRTNDQFVLIINVDTKEVVEEGHLNKGETLDNLYSKDPSKSLDWLI